MNPTAIYTNFLKLMGINSRKIIDKSCFMRSGISSQVYDLFMPFVLEYFPLFHLTLCGLSKD